MLGLVTHMDEDRIVLGFKVVKIESSIHNSDSTCLCVFVYSSETCIWTSKKLHCPHYFTIIYASITLNGTLYLSSCVDDYTESEALCSS